MIRKIDSNIFSLTILKVTTFSRIRQIKTRNVKEIQTVLINLCLEFDNLGHCPLQISVPDLATESVLKAFCKALKIKLVKERRPLRDLNDAWEYLHNYSMDM